MAVKSGHQIVGLDETLPDLLFFPLCQIKAQAAGKLVQQKCNFGDSGKLPGYERRLFSLMATTIGPLFS